MFVEAQPALPEADSETTSEGYYENFVPPNLHTYQHIWGKIVSYKLMGKNAIKSNGILLFKYWNNMVTVRIKIIRKNAIIIQVLLPWPKPVEGSNPFTNA